MSETQIKKKKKKKKKKEVLFTILFENAPCAVLEASVDVSKTAHSAL